VVLLPQAQGSVDVVELVVVTDVLVELVELDDVELVFEVLVVLVELVLVDEVLVELELVLVLVVLERRAQASGAGASFRFVSPPWLFTPVPPKRAQYRFESVPRVRITPTSPCTGGARVTPDPLQTALITFSLTSTILHGSVSEPAPLYLKPLAPGGFPRPFQPAAGRSYVSSPAIPASVSKMRSVPPATVGSLVADVGSAKGVASDLATNLASVPGPLITVILPGMSSSGSSTAQLDVAAIASIPVRSILPAHRPATI
jgi:hypothetical protein